MTGSSSRSTASDHVQGARGGKPNAPWRRALSALLACGLWQTQHACAQTVADMFIDDPGMAPLAPNESLATDLIPIRRPDGTIGLAEFPDSSKRPFKLAFYEVGDPAVPQENRNYVANTIMPGVASLLARFVRVRYPSGPLQFTGRVDFAGDPIPPGPGPGGAYDADLVVKVTSATRDNPDCDGNFAFAVPWLFETLTRRPTFGDITLCDMNPRTDIAANMAIVLHEHIHVLGFSGSLFTTFFGFQGLQDVAKYEPGVPDDDYDYFFGQTGRFSYAAEALYAAAYPGAAPSNYDLQFALDFFGFGDYAYAPAAYAPGPSPGPDAVDLALAAAAPGRDGAAAAPLLPPLEPEPANILDLFYGDGYGPRRTFDAVTPFTGQIVSPNALREARAHIGCPSMQFVLLQEATSSAFTSHWSQRHYRGDIMQPTANADGGHIAREVMTDLTLGLLQDTGWYNVKYGSGGFNTYGYRAGCEFVDLNTTIEALLEDPAASPFVCTAEQVGTAQCFHDFSGSGICVGELLLGYDDLYIVNELYDYRDDCQDEAGARCISGEADGVAPVCAAGFSCSEDGRVLLDGAVCSELMAGCPPDGLMCGDPGLLTCAGPELNDCNGRGDCRQGRCFCHTGFGGADCTTPVCTGGCDDGSPCPPSGFCGVPECGEWSSGATGKGTPCDRN